MRSAFLAVALLLGASPGALAQKFYTYVGDIGTDYVLLAWGTTAGTNTIGRSSASHGPATIKVGTQSLTSEKQNWITVRGLKPDTEYPYEVQVGGRKVGEGKVRTWPLRSEKVCFFVIGDWGTGDTHQFQVADAMRKEFLRRASSDNPVRFVLSTGDNIYGQLNFMLAYRNSGDRDRDWGAKFFEPYQQVIAQVPFYPVLGNHDGNETEARNDLTTYLDNFFFPGGSAARYYRLSFGGLVDVFALDSTQNTEVGPPVPAYSKGSQQHQWFEKNITESQTPWKIPILHHPLYNAGPRHAPVLRELEHFVELFKKTGVKVVFSGHEHNFQYTQANAATSGIRYVVTGAGGELRSSDVKPRMEATSMEAWAPQLHYCVVEIENKEMRITPMSFQAVNVVDKDGKKVEMPLKVTLP